MAMRGHIRSLHHHIQEAMRVVFHGCVKIVINAQPGRPVRALDEIVEQGAIQSLNCVVHPRVQCPRSRTPGVCLAYCTDIKRVCLPAVPPSLNVSDTRSLFATGGTVTLN